MQSLLLCGLLTMQLCQNRCFPSKAQLEGAVNDYISQDCTKDPGCEVGQAYGWPMNSWCVSQVTDMSGLFSSKDKFNEDISGWDTSNVVNMRAMFSNARSFNRNINAWNTASVTDMELMFNNGKLVCLSDLRFVSLLTSTSCPNLLHTFSCFF